MGITNLWDRLESTRQLYSLDQLVAEHKGPKPLRLAIDVAQWNFHAKRSQGGLRPGLRLLFSRLAHLYTLGVQAVFVFDGHNRPTRKRGRHVNVHYVSEDRLAQETLIRLFDFAIWYAYGDAEAECAVLQRLNMVDVVLTHDSDIFLYGASRVIREFSCKAFDPLPCYDITWINEQLGLDRSDLILMGLLSGSDYNPKGARRIGITYAEALARRGHHKPLLEALSRRHTGKKIVDKDEYELLLANLGKELKENLVYDLQNRCSEVKRAYPDFKLDGDFPNLAVLEDFVYPTTRVSSKHKVKETQCLVRHLARAPQPRLDAIAAFCTRAFEWPPSYTVWKFKNQLLQGYMLGALHEEARTRGQRQTGLPLTGQTQIHHFFKPDLRRSTAEDDHSSSGSSSSGKPTLGEGVPAPNRLVKHIVRRSTKQGVDLVKVYFDPLLLDSFVDYVEYGLQVHFEFDGVFGSEMSDLSKDSTVDDKKTKSERCSQVIEARVLQAAYPEDYPRMLQALETPKRKPRTTSEKETKAPTSKNKKAATRTKKGQTLLSSTFKPDLARASSSAFASSSVTLHPEKKHASLT